MISELIIQFDGWLLTCDIGRLDKIKRFLPNIIKYDYILITYLIHRLLFIHKIIFSSTCFETQVLIFRRIQLYTCSI